MILDFHRAAEIRPLDVLLEVLLAALREKQFPILVSDTVWNEFVSKRNIFATKLQDPSSLEYAYYTFFIALQKKVKEESIGQSSIEFYTLPICQELSPYIFEENPKMPPSASELTKQFIELNIIAYQHKDALNDLYHNFTCYIFLTAHEWQAYKYAVAPGSKEKPYEVVLLIPKTYLNSHPCGLQRNARYALDFSDETNLPLLFRSGITDKEVMKKTFAQKPSAQEMYTLFSKIFTTEITKDPELCPFFIPAWNIFLAGHETTLTDVAFASINNLGNNIVALEKQLLHIKKPLANKKIPAAQFNEEIVQFEHETKNINASIQKYQAELANLLKENTNTVASVPLFAFQNGFLEFFSREIPTNFLFILSCFTAGKNMSLIYNIPGLERTYPFTIATAATTDAIATGQHFIPVNLLSLNFSVDEGNIVLVSSPMKFAAFFDALSTTYSISSKKESSLIAEEASIKPQSYENIISHVHDFMIPSTNLGTIRPAHTSFGHTIKMGKTKERVDRRLKMVDRVMYITRLTIAQKYYEKKDINISEYIKTVILYEQNIPLFINIPPANPYKDIPAFISQIPGKAVHYIQKLSAGNKRISILSECFLAKNIMRTEKVFVFDTIENTMTTEKNLFQLGDEYEKITITHVIIGHNMPNPFAGAPIVSGFLCTYNNEAYSMLLDPEKGNAVVKTGKLSADETVIYQKLFNDYKAEATKEPIMDIEAVTKFMEKKPKHRPEYPSRGG